MADYRMYMISGIDQIVCPSLIIRSSTDDDAFSEAQKLATATHGVEVWQSGRLVSSVPPAKSS